MKETNVNVPLNTSIAKPKRFPGVASFEDDELASELFFGREVESQKVLHYILAENLVVIFSYSGYGKTSLLKAGVFKKLRERDLFPVLARFNKKEYSPTQVIRAEIDSLKENAAFEVLEKEGSTTLSELFKGLEIWTAENKLVTPVIVFDQFEEIFTLEHNQQYIAGFFQELASLLKLCKEGELNIKLVISLREDFLGHLEKMATNIPSVFTNRFRLEALKKDAAQKAIIEPAAKQIEGIEFATKPFTFSGNAVNELLDFLALKMTEGKWTASEEIEPIQLQIICSELENKIISNDITSRNNGVVEIQTTDFGGKDGLQKIVANFYEQQIIKVKNELKLNEKEVSAIKDVIETGLITGSRRVPMAYDTVISRPNINRKAVDLLITNKLLKLESHRDNALLELSHDTLVAPVINAGKKSSEEKYLKKRRTSFIRYALILALILLIGLYLAISTVNSKKASQDKYYYAALLASRENPTLGYKIALDGKSIGFTTAKLNTLLNQFKNGNNAFMTGKYHLEDVLYAYFSTNNSTLNIFGKRVIERWQTNGVFINSTAHDTTRVPSINLINGKNYTMCYRNNRIELVDEANKVVSSVDLTNAQNSTDEEVIIMTDIFEQLYKNYSAQQPVKHFKIDIQDYFLNCSFYQSADGKRSVLLNRNNSMCHYHDLSRNERQTLSEPDSFINGTAKVAPNKRGDFSKAKTDQNVESKVYSIAVTNDFTKLIYASSEGIYSVHLADTSGKRTKERIKYDENPAEGSCIAVSPNDQLIVTTVGGGEASVWNLNGQKLATLKGHKYKISGCTFSFDSKSIVTWDQGGEVITWKTGKDIQEKELVKFSPFDYHSLGLTENKYAVYKIYDTSTVENLVAAALHYESAIPATNIYPGDINYSSSLKKSITEVEDLFAAIVRSPRYYTLKDEQKSRLFSKYLGVIAKASYLVEPAVDLSAHHKKALQLYTDDRINAYLQKAGEGLPTSIVQEQVGYLRDFYVTHKDYKEANEFTKKMIRLLQGMQSKQVDKTAFNPEIAGCYIDLSYYKLFEKDFPGAIKAGFTSLSLDSSSTLPYTNIAAAYLLNKQFAEAEKIYTKYKDERRQGFIDDFKALKAAEIINGKDPAIVKEVDRITQMLSS